MQFEQEIGLRIEMEKNKRLKISIYNIFDQNLISLTYLIAMKARTCSILAEYIDFPK